MTALLHSCHVLESEEIKNAEMRIVMTRREVREQMFVLLFQREFFGVEEFEEQKETYFLTHDIDDKNKEYMLRRLDEIGKEQEKIDALISGHSMGWKIDRIGKEELAILRLAVYEALYDDEIPVGVAVNEAVELGKKYGAEGGASFINGMLGKIVNE